MAKIPGLQRRRNAWYLRVRVPQDLMPSYKKSEIIRTLETRDHAVAAKRIHIVRAQIEAEFEMARQKITASQENPDILGSLSEHELMALTSKWFAGIREAEEKRRLKDNGAWTEARKADYEIELLQEELEAREEVLGLSDRDKHNGMTSAGEFLKEEGITYDPKSENFRRLGRFFTKAIHDLAQRSLREYQGKAHIANDPMFSDHAVAPAANGFKPEKPIRMGDLVDEFLNDPKLRRSESTIKNYLVIRRAIDEVIGNKTYAHLVTREQCKEVGNLLIALPSNPFKRTKAKTLRDAVKMGKEQNLSKVADTTYNMYMQKFDALMEHAVRETYIASNPAKKLYVASTMKSKHRRHPFKLEQLKAIFGSSLYTQEREKALTYNPKMRLRTIYGRYWVPYIALWTGMRLNEICQLYASDIETVDNVPIILIRETDGDDDETETEKRVKTENGIRFVPMHPTLAGSGFLDYVESIRKAGKTRLFPDLKLDKRGYYSHEYSKWFSRHLKVIRAKTPRTSFHSFRHTYRDALRKARLPRDVALQLGGWSSDATDDDYGEGLGPRDLYRELCEIKFEGLDLSHICK